MHICFACWWTPENSECLTEVTTFWVQKTTQKLVLYTYPLFKCYFQSFEKLCSISYQFQATLHADMLLFQVCRFEGSPELYLLWQSHIPHAYSKLEITLRIPLCLHLMKEVCASAVVLSQGQFRNWSFLDSHVYCELTLHYFRVFCV